MDGSRAPSQARTQGALGLYARARPRTQLGATRSRASRRQMLLGGSRLFLSCGDEQDAVDLVDLHELHLDALVPRGRKVLAHVVRADRQLSVAAVGEAGELDARGAPVVEERLDGGANRPARVEDV